MFCKNDSSGYREVLAGIRLKTMVFGEKTLLAQFRLKKGCKLPIHSHPHEQTGFLVSGRLRLFIGEEGFDVKPGDSWCILGDVEHGAEILEDSVAVEVFSPVRKDYLPENLT